jgi:hypothetical protein
MTENDVRAFYLPSRTNCTDVLADFEPVPIRARNAASSAISSSRLHFRSAPQATNLGARAVETIRDPTPRDGFAGKVSVFMAKMFLEAPGVARPFSLHV